jgi:hypothetical protein
MNTAIAANYDASNGFFLPAGRINNGLTLEALSAIGIIAAGEQTELGYRRCMLPEGWTPVPAAESIFQVRLQDGLGRLRAKIFYKPGSQGGRASMEVTPRFTVALRTNETLQWGEVYDGNELIHRTASAPKTVDEAGFGAYKQLQYSEAEAWLNSREPESKNPLAYWN